MRIEQEKIEGYVELTQQELMDAVRFYVVNKLGKQVEIPIQFPTYVLTPVGEQSKWRFKIE